MGLYLLAAQRPDEGYSQGVVHCRESLGSNWYLITDGRPTVGAHHLKENYETH